MGSEIAAGGRLRDRFGFQNPAPVFGVLGVALLGGGLAVPAFETLLFVWGGTALFVALLLQFVLTGSTLPATVTTDIYTTMASNARRGGSIADHQLDRTEEHQYVPDSDAPKLIIGDREFDPVGQRLLATSGDFEPTGTVDDQLSVLADVVVNDLELASRFTATTEAETATVTVTGSRIGTTELFDHPVASVIGVGLARGLDSPIAVETTLKNETLVVTAEPTSIR